MLLKFSEKLLNFNHNLPIKNVFEISCKILININENVQLFYTKLVKITKQVLKIFSRFFLIFKKIYTKFYLFFV